MKITLLVSVILAGTAAFAQSAGVLSNVPQELHMAEHPMHAEVTAMASEHFLVGGGTYTVAHGGRPLWELGPVSAPERPPGDVARAVREAAESARQAARSRAKKGSEAR